MGQNTNSVEDKEETQLDNLIPHASTDSESEESTFKDKIKFTVSVNSGSNRQWLNKYCIEKEMISLI